MEDDLINYFLAKYRECYDRFTFDDLFRFLLSQGFDAEETKDIILNHCQLSALVFQERIENYFYQKISLGEKMSADLLELINEIYKKHFFTNWN